MLNTKVNTHAITDISLAKFKVWNIAGDRRGDLIDCSSGILWVTQEGDMKDYILEAGKKFWVTRPGTVVVQALADARFKYSLNELESHIELNKQPIRRSLLTRSHRLR